MSVQILTGDCREVMAGMEAESVHCVITSPPYWGLRDYGIEPLVWGDDGCEHRWGDEMGPVKQGGQQDYSSSTLKRDGRPEESRLRTMENSAERGAPVSTAGQFWKVAQYERDWAQKRLASIRHRRAQIIRLLDAPTLTEHLEAGGDVLAYPPEATERRIGPENRRKRNDDAGMFADLSSEALAKGEVG